MLEEGGAHIRAEIVPFTHDGAVLGPGGVERGARRDRERIVTARRGEENDAARQRSRWCLVQEALAASAETPERDADREGDEADRRRQVVVGLVGRQRLAG